MDANRKKPQYGTPTCVRVFFKGPLSNIWQVVVLGGQFEKNLSKSPYADPKPTATIDIIRNQSWSDWEKCMDWVIWAEASGWESSIKNNIQEWRPKEV